MFLLEDNGKSSRSPSNEVNLPYTDTQSNCQKLGIFIPFWFSKHFVPSAELSAAVEIKETIKQSLLLGSNSLTRESDMTHGVTKTSESQYQGKQKEDKVTYELRP